MERAETGQNVGRATRYSDCTALVAVWLLVSLPLTTPLLLVTPSAHNAYTLSPYLVFSVSCGLLFAGWIARKDAWLGAAVAWPVLMCLWNPRPSSYETALTMLLGGFLLTTVWAWKGEWLGLAQHALTAAAVTQAGYALLQPFGYDPLWNYTQAEILNRTGATGTLGNNNWLGAYLAMLLPLIPAWAMVIVVAGLVASKCFTGIVAAACGLAWMDKARRWYWLAGGAVLFAAVIWLRGPRWDGGLQERLTIWQWMVQIVPSWKWLTGFGPGSWSDLVPRWQLGTFGHQYPVYVQAHNELLQVLFETGVVGLLLIGAWLWSKRAMLQGPYGGSVLAMAICSMLMFPFRLAVVGGTALVILGLATRKPCSMS